MGDIGNASGKPETAGDGLWRPTPDPGSVRRRAAYVEAVDASRFDLPALPDEWDTGMLRAIADPEPLNELMPPRRGRVQGPAIRAGLGVPDVPDLWVPLPVDVARPVPPRPTTRRVLSSSASMAAATMTSRISSLASQILQAAALGSSLLATTFTVGNTLPSMIYFLLIGGALNTVFVPQLVRAMNRDPDGGDTAAVRDDLSLGLRISAVAIVPAAFAFPALGPQLAVVLFGHGDVKLGEAHGIGYMLTAFGIGLIPFSAQYVVLRGFYAFEDTRTPFFISLLTGLANTAIAVAAYTVLGHTRWPVVAMAAGCGISSTAGLAYTARRLRTRLAPATRRPGRAVKRTYLRLVGAGAFAAVVAFAVAQSATAAAGPTFGGSLLAVTAGGAALLGVFVVMAKALRISELDVLTGLLRERLSR